MPAADQPREDLDAPGILSVSTMLSDHSKPNGETDTEDSQNSWPRERWGQNSAYDTLGIAHFANFATGVASSH
jgi:hypothetical protein